jgi:integrase
MGKAKSNGHPGLYKRGRYWWLTRDPVTGRAESTRCTSLKAAQACLAERERLAADPTYAASQAARLGSQVAAFLDMKSAAKRSTATMGYYREKLGHWLRMFGDAPLARFVDPATFDAFVAQRRDEEASDHTISKEVRVFSQVLKMAKRAGHYGGDITILKPHDLTTSYVPRTRAMTTDEAARLWPELSTRWAALLDISVALGLRLSECAKIDPQRDVDLVTGLVTVRGTKTKGSARIVPILSPFRPLVERALPHLPVGPGNNLYRDVANACKRAGVQYATPNDWRRSHATILAELGVDADVLRRLLGHTTRQMVDRIYSQPRPEAIGRLAELAIAQRSAGVVRVAECGSCSSIAATAKCAETQQSDDSSDDHDGFLSRRSQVQILSGAPRKATKLPGHNGQCSAGVATTINAWALAYAAHRLGVLPEKRVA